jgi:hypothetical protein
LGEKCSLYLNKNRYILYRKYLRYVDGDDETQETSQTHPARETASAKFYPNGASHKIGIIVAATT